MTQEPNASLHQDLEAHAPATGQPPSDYRWPPALDFEVYMARKRESFTGRAWLLEEIQQWLTAGAGSCALLIKADPGVGKSAFLSEYVHRFRGRQVLAWHFCRHDRPQTLQPGSFVRSLAAGIARALPEFRQRIESSPEAQKALEDADRDPASALDKTVLRPLASVCAPDAARALVVDALDESLTVDESLATRSNLAELLGSVAKQFPDWLRLIATSRPVPEILAPLQAGFRLHEIGADDARNVEDLRQYVQEAVRRKDILQERLTAGGTSAASLADLLCARSGGKFLFALHALRELADGTLTMAMLEELPPEGMDGFYRSAFRRRFGHKAQRYGEARALLGVMCACLEPVTACELAQILEVTEQHVLAVRAPVADFIKLSTAGSQLSFDHASLKDWLTLAKEGLPRAGDFAVDLTLARRQLHRWALRQVEAEQAHTSAYLLCHLAAHLQDAAQRQAIYMRLLLKSFQWWQARLDLSGLRGVLADVEHLRGHPQAPMLRALIRQAEPALLVSSTQWLAQVLGRLGARSYNIGLESLATAAERWLLHRGAAPAPLVPVHRSLRWHTGLNRQLEGSGPVVVLADGRIAYARRAGVCVYDPAAWGEPQVLEGHTANVTSLAALPDGRVCSGSADHTVRVWDLASRDVTLLEGHTEGVATLAALPDGRLASGGDDDTVRLWDIDSRTSQVLAGHTATVRSLAVLPDGRLASGSWDHSIRVWDLRSGAVQVLEGHTSVVSSLAVLPDGRLASASWDKSVRVWDLTSGVAQVLEGHAKPVYSLALPPDGRVISGSQDNTLRVWDLGSGASDVLEGHSCWVLSLAVLADGRVVSGGSDFQVRVWDLGSGASRVLEGHTHWVTSVAVLPGGRAVSASDDQTVRIWDLGDSTAQTLEGHTAEVASLALLPDGRVVSASEDHTLRVWDLGQGSSQVLEGHTDGVCTIAALPDGRVVSGGDDRTVRVWDLARGASQVVKRHRRPVWATAVLTDGRVVCSAAGRYVHVWDTRSGTCQELEGHKSTVSTVAALPDGRVVSGGWDNTVRVWHLDTGACQVLEGHANGIFSLAILADGRVASGSSDHTVRVWDLSSGASQVLEGHTHSVARLALLPDGRLISGSVDHTLRLWDLSSGASRVLVGHTDRISALAVLPDGRVVSSSADRTVRVWSRKHQTEHMFVADAAVRCLTVTPSGVVVAGCVDGSVHFLRIP